MAKKYRTSMAAMRHHKAMSHPFSASSVNPSKMSMRQMIRYRKQMRKKTLRRHRAKERALKGIGHDMRHPLSALKGKAPMKAKRTNFKLAQGANHQATDAVKDMNKSRHTRNPITKMRDTSKATGHIISAITGTSLVGATQGGKLTTVGSRAKHTMALASDPHMKSLKHYRQYNNMAHPGHNKGAKKRFISHVKKHRWMYNYPTVKHMHNGKMIKTHFYAQAQMKPKSQIKSLMRTRRLKHEDKMHMKGMPTHHDLKKGHGVYMNKKHHTVIGIGPAIVDGENKIFHSHHKEHHHSKSYRMKAPNASINHSYERQHSAQKQNAVSGPNAQNQNGLDY